MSTSLASSVLLCAVEGTELSGAERSFYLKNPPAGFTLFSRNFSDHYPEVSKLTGALQEFSAVSSIIAIDQEGGRVNRVKGGFVDQGPALKLSAGSSEPVALVEIKAYAASLGAALLDLGINTNFAPVVDVLTNPDNHAIGDRAFGTSSEEVSKRAKAFLDGQSAAGVTSCLKHFPGQGAANSDTHLGSAIISMSLADLESVHLKPFQELISSVGMVMISHCVYDCLDSIPASVSPIIIRELLINKLGFKGLVVSDDFNMEAIAQDEKSWQEAIVEAVAAGNHLILVCRHLEKSALAVEVLTRESQKSKAFLKILEDAATKTTSFRIHGR